jgi:4-amino-4-deoxy-L-arabinose transferase-like glycosyltransferase
LSFWDRTAAHVVILLGVAALTLLPLLGEVRYVDGREARHAKIAQTMLETGTYSVPYVNGKPYIDKPPLFNWAQALFYSLAGGASAASFLLARLPSVLCAVLALLCVYALGCRWLSARAGFLSALIWITSFLVVQWAHFARPDVMLAALVVLAVLLADLAATAGPGWRRMGWWCAAAVMLGAATLSKGPQSLFFWIVPVAALWPARGGRRIPPLALLGLALAIVGIMAAAWLLRAEHLHPGHFRELTGYQFGEGLVEHPKRITLCLDEVFAKTLPWSIFIFGAFYWSVRKARREGYSAALVPALTVAVCLIALTILPNKRAHYLLPVAPFWALLLGMFLDRALACRLEGGREPCGLGLKGWTFEWPLGVCLGLLALGCAATAYYLRNRLHGYGLAAVVYFSLLALLSAAGLYSLLKGRARRAFVVFCALCVLVLASVNVVSTLYAPPGVSERALVLSSSGPMPELLKDDGDE